MSSNPYLVPGLQVFTAVPARTSAQQGPEQAQDPAAPVHPILAQPMATTAPQRATTSAPEPTGRVSAPSASHDDEPSTSQPSFMSVTFDSTLSALAGLTVQQIMDLDVENLAVKIDSHHSQTKKAVLDHVMDMKVRMLAAQASAVEEERRAGNTRLAAKQSEMEMLQQELAQAGGRGNQLAEYLRRMAAVYDLSKHRHRCLGLLHQAFYAWLHYSVVSRRAKVRMQRAERWYDEAYLKRRAFRGWFKAALQQRRVTLMHKYERDLEEARGQIAGQYAGQINDLRDQLQDVHQQLAREAEARAKLEENMKQAFMRGVCALNIEAMSIMKRGAPPGGANPVPITLPAHPGSQPPGMKPGSAAPPGPQAGPTGPSPAPSLQQQQQPMPAGQAPQYAPVTAAAAAPGGSSSQTSLTHLPSTFNLDLHGSLTLSPSMRPATSTGSSSMQNPAAAATFTATASASGTAAASSTAARAQLNPAASPQLAAGSSGPSSGTMGVRTTASHFSSTPSGPPLHGAPPAAQQVSAPLISHAPVPSTVAAPHAAAPMPQPMPQGPPQGLGTTAQAFYQRPKVMVTRGPGLGPATGQEAPQPRVVVPVPSAVRPAYGPR